MSAEKINVAVVDDDGSFCRALGRLLRAAGFEPAMYPSAEAFLQDLARARVDCLVLDIHLGGMSGFDLQKHLAASGPAPPIIFMTGHEEPETPEPVRRAGCVAFLRKPFAGDSLIEAIRRAVTAKM